MSQAFTDDCFATTANAFTNLQAFENNFAALKSMFSGATAPANLVAGMHWFDTAKKALKMRNNADSAWLGILQADASHKLWVYRNTAPDGWAIDSAVVDCVLALKGGTNAYNASGGTQAGTWTQPDCTLSLAQVPAHTHGAAGGHYHQLKTYYGSGIEGAITAVAISFTVSSAYSGASWTGSNEQAVTDTEADHTHASVGSGSAHNHGGTTYRPAAAIGTLQYMDL